MSLKVLMFKLFKLIMLLSNKYPMFDCSDASAESGKTFENDVTFPANSCRVSKRNKLGNITSEKIIIKPFFNLEIWQSFNVNKNVKMIAGKKVRIDR